MMVQEGWGRTRIEGVRCPDRELRRRFLLRGVRANLAQVLPVGTKGKARTMWRNVDTKTAFVLPENHTVIPATEEELAKLAAEEQLRDSKPLTELERIRLRERTVRELSANP